MKARGQCGGSHRQWALPSYLRFVVESHLAEEVVSVESPCCSHEKKPFGKTSLTVEEGWEVLK
jgi:hypothetical protein